MGYIRHVPAPPLNTFIEYFYAIEGPMPYRREKILPMGWVDLEINLGGPIQIYDASGNQAIATCVESWWAGMWSTYATVEWPSHVQYVAIHFKPGGAYPFLNFPLSELHNQIVPADVILGPSAGDMRDQLSSASTVQARFVLLEHLLLARLGEAPQELGLVSYGVEEIARQQGRLSIRALSDAMGISQKHLITQFKLTVGVSPKALAQLFRLKHVLAMITPVEPVDWGLLAQHAGYYDQAHFSKDFKAFLGHSPTDYLQLRRQLHTLDPERDRLLHIVPIG